MGAAVLQVAHTAELDAAVLAATRALLAAVFAGHFHDDDWEHALGGMHALVWEDGELIGHASVVQRRLVQRGRLSALTPSGVQATPDEEGAVYVFPNTVALDLGGELTCDWRDGDVW